MELAVIHFGPKVAPPAGYDGPPVAIGYMGWSLEIEYDHDGKIQNYHLSNLWKGTHFSSELPDQKEAARHAFIFFADQTFLPRRPDGKAEGVSYIGSYMDLDNDSNGAIQNYHLSNLHKGGSRRTNGKRPISVAELKQLYEIEKSERERRDVALRALDEAVIQTFGPINISTIDEIFGTHLASQLPTKKEGKRIGVVDFSSPVPISPNPAVKTEAAGKNGWFMAVEYDYNGNIQNYYLTNVHM